MERNEIAALAKGMVPFVHEAVAEAVASTTTVPLELVEQIKNAEAALREPMPTPSDSAPPIAPAVTIASLRHVTGAIITRTGELALSYSDGSSERLGPVIGPSGAQGEKGASGERGADGIGVKGDDGAPGRDGAGIVAAAINRDGELMLTLSDGTVLTPGRVTAGKK